MALSVNVYPTSWQALGSTAPCPQFQMTLSFQWVNDAGQPQTWGPQTVTFPNIIAQLTPPESAALADAMQDVIISIARRRAGID